MNILYIQYIPLLGLIGLIALINSVNRLTVNQVNLQHVQRSQKKWTVWQKLQPSHTATGWASGFHVAESSKQFQSPSLKSSGHILIHWSKSSLKSASIQKILHYPKTGNKNRIWALHRYLNHWRLHNFAMEKWLYDATQTCLTAAGGATGATWDGVGVGCGRRFRSIFFSMRKTKATLELQIQLWRNWDSLQTSLSLHLELDASCQYVPPITKTQLHLLLLLLLLWNIVTRMTLDLCRMLFFFTMKHWGTNIVWLWFTAPTTSCISCKPGGFWRRSNQPWGLLFQYQVSLWNHKAKEITRIHIYVTHRKTGKSIFQKKTLFHWSVNVSGKYSWRIPGTPRFLVTFFPHVSEDSTDDHRMQGLMLKIVEGWRNPSNGTMNWIEFYHRKCRVMDTNLNLTALTGIETVAIPVSGHFLQTVGVFGHASTSLSISFWKRLRSTRGTDLNKRYAPVWTTDVNYISSYLFTKNGSDISFVLLVDAIVVVVAATRIIGRPEMVAAGCGSCQSPKVTSTTTGLSSMWWCMQMYANVACMCVMYYPVI